MTNKENELSDNDTIKNNLQKTIDQNNKDIDELNKIKSDYNELVAKHNNSLSDYYDLNDLYIKYMNKTEKDITKYAEKED